MTPASGWVRISLGSPGGTRTEREVITTKRVSGLTVVLAPIEETHLSEKASNARAVSLNRKRASTSGRMCRK